MKRALVTGASTPIGESVVRTLAGEEGVEAVLAVVGRRDHRPMSFEDYENVHLVHVDLTRARDVRSLLFGTARDLGIDTVVHTALHRSARDGGRTVHALNVESTHELVRLSERHPTVRRIVFRSYADVYQLRPNRPTLILEDHPLELSPSTPQWVRDRVAADLTVGARMGMSSLDIAILRCAECLSADSGSQLHDYLASRVCFTPLGFDPMLNVISVADVVEAVRLASHSDAIGIFNVPGKDTLPLSAVVRRAGRARAPVPGALLSPLYGLRARMIHTDFRYDQNYWRFHFGGVLDGRRARAVLGYEPRYAVDWREAGGHALHAFEPVTASP